MGEVRVHISESDLMLALNLILTGQATIDDAGAAIGVNDATLYSRLQQHGMTCHKKRRGTRMGIYTISANLRDRLHHAGYDVSSFTLTDAGGDAPLPETEPLWAGVDQEADDALTPERLTVGGDGWTLKDDPTQMLAIVRHYTGLIDRATESWDAQELAFERERDALQRENARERDAHQVYYDSIAAKLADYDGLVERVKHIEKAWAIDRPDAERYRALMKEKRDIDTAAAIDMLLSKGKGLSDRLYRNTKMTDVLVVSNGNGHHKPEKAGKP